MKEKGVIYKIQCECGDPCVGETGRTLETRLKDLRAPESSVMDDSKNGIAACSRQQHSPQYPMRLRRSPQPRAKLAQEEDKGSTLHQRGDMFHAP